MCKTGEKADTGIAMQLRRLLSRHIMWIDHRQHGHTTDSSPTGT